MSYYYLNMFNHKYRLKFQLAMNNVYFLCLRQHVTLKNGGGGGSGLDFVILLSEGGGGVSYLLQLITEGGGGG